MTDLDEILVEDLKEGRIDAFHPKRHYVQDKKTFPEHGKLVELFTNSNMKSTHAAEAAFDAIAEYFDVETSDDPVAVLEYHVTFSGRSDPLAVSFSKARADFYGVKRVPAAIFDGTRSSHAAGTKDEIISVYESYLKLARSAESASADAATDVWRRCHRKRLSPPEGFLWRCAPSQCLPIGWREEWKSR